MSTEYEHEGVFYYEPLPRVLLCNFSPSLTQQLTERLHNVSRCDTIKIEQGKVLTLKSPRAAYEVDVLLVRDHLGQLPPTDLDALSRSLGVPLAPDYRQSFASSLMLSGGDTESLDSFYTTVVNRGGVCVFFLSDRPSGLFRGFNYSALQSRRIVPGQNAHRLLDTPPEWEPLKGFLERTFRQAAVCVAVHQYGTSANAITIPVLVDPTDLPYAAGITIFGSDNRHGRVLILPDYGESQDILDLLLSEILPELSPQLFPFRHDLTWVKECEFRHPGVSALEEQRVQIHAEAVRQVAELDRQIHHLDESERFLQHLLTTDGDILKAAVKLCLDALFRAAGVTNVTLIDVDHDPADRAGEKPKREDLRVEWGGQTTLINVSGRERFFRQTSINQVAEHERRYLSATKLPVTQVHSLLIANFNYGGGIDPRKRGDIFGSGTAEARERLLSQGHGALGTYDLYRIFRAVQTQRIAISPQTLKELLATEGIFDYATFTAAHPPLESAPLDSQ